MRKINDSEQPLLASNELFDSDKENKPDEDEVLDRDEFERMEAIALKNRAQTITTLSMKYAHASQEGIKEEMDRFDERFDVAA